MQSSETITCPYCGQAFELMVEPLIDRQDLVTDCEICCRPFNVRVECTAGEVASIEVMN